MPHQPAGASVAANSWRVIALEQRHWVREWITTMNLTARQRTTLISVGVIVILGLVFFLFNRFTGTSSTTTPGSHQFGVQTKTSGCAAHGGLPDSACTPGALLSTGTKSAICQSGYASSVRNVPDSEKNQVYAEYGITSHTSGEYEVDHLVSLELGGSNEIANLWPEAANPTPGFHQKDQVENYLHDQVCSGAISLSDAQVEIATDWLSVYNRMPK
jgi:hypothetical protein